MTKHVSADTKRLCEMLMENETIKDNGIKGNIRRRFTKDEILNAIN